MKKTLLLASAAVALVALNANAVEFNPYVSGNVTYSKVKVDGTQTYNPNPGYSDKAKIKDNVYGFNVAAGASTKVMGGAVRGELEFGFKDGLNKDYTSQGTYVSSTNKAIMKADTTTYMVNGYYDIDTGTKFTPYVGAGLGIAHVKIKSDYTDSAFGGAADVYMKESSTNFAWQVGAGVGYALTDNIALNLGYRYTDFGSAKANGFNAIAARGTNINAKVDLTSHEVMLGARYAF